VADNHTQTLALLSTTTNTGTQLTQTNRHHLGGNTTVTNMGDDLFQNG
jgi:hypothetical protein